MEIEDTSSDQNHKEFERSLDFRVVEVIKKNGCTPHTKSYKVRPAQVASELGISIDDANAELCGLMRAVGESASFQFESIPINNSTISSHSHSGRNIQKRTTVMIFHFPTDFERKAYFTKRKENLREIMWNFMCALFKVMKVIVAFGLIISAMVVVVYAIVIMLALIVGFARAGGRQTHHHANRIQMSIRMISYMMRQFYWIYMIVRGFDQIDTVDPFIADIAYTLAFICNPYSYLMWFRMMNRRNYRNRATRGWRSNSSGFMRTSTWNQSNTNNQETEVNNIYSFNNRMLNNVKSSHQSDERGMLSNAVEFLFGPTPVQSGPSEFEKWKLRESFILSQISQTENEAINILQLLPFVDNPPPNADVDELRRSTTMRSECLNIITHFNGVPFNEGIRSSNENTKSSHDVKFAFPELLSLHAENLIGEVRMTFPDSDEVLNHSFLYIGDVNSDQNSDQNSMNTRTSPFSGQGHVLGGSKGRLTAGIQKEKTLVVTRPKFLLEKKCSFSKLTKNQFYQCIRLNIINCIGLMITLKLLQTSDLKSQLPRTQGFLISFTKSLFLYAKFFFILPLCRMIVLLVMNKFIMRRNSRRKAFAKQFVNL